MGKPLFMIQNRQGPTLLQLPWFLYKTQPGTLTQRGSLLVTGWESPCFALSVLTTPKQLQSRASLRFHASTCQFSCFSLNYTSIYSHLQIIARESVCSFAEVFLKSPFKIKFFNQKSNLLFFFKLYYYDNGHASGMQPWAEMGTLISAFQVMENWLVTHAGLFFLGVNLI